MMQTGTKADSRLAESLAAAVFDELDRLSEDPSLPLILWRLSANDRGVTISGRIDGDPHFAKGGGWAAALGMNEDLVDSPTNSRPIDHSIDDACANPLTACDGVEHVTPALAGDARHWSVSEGPWTIVLSAYRAELPARPDTD